MQGKFVFGGDGAQVPGTDFGIAFGIFKFFLCATGGEWRGYTTASNEGLLGAAIIESPIIDFVMPDLDDEAAFDNLHAAPVDVTLDSTLFAVSGGTATITVRRRTNDGSPEKVVTFFSDECKGARHPRHPHAVGDVPRRGRGPSGFSASLGPIHFRATLLVLPEEEWDAPSLSYVPW